MNARFIAHAGVHIGAGTYNILIDPWFSDSSFDDPIIESIGSSHKSIDFQYPKTTETPEDHDPDVILLSHFHSHHSLKKDILALCQKSDKNIQVIYPGSGDAVIRENLGAFGHVSLIPIVGNTTVTVGDDIIVKGLTHTVKDHVAWYVEVSGGIFSKKTMSLMHIADARIHTDRLNKNIDKVWVEFKELSPDILLLGAGGNSLRREIEGQRVIHEATVCTPVEAARLVQHIKPKVVSLIGCYNYSVYTQRFEYVRHYPLIEHEFEWAVSWLSPETTCIFSRPGTKYFD